MTTSVEIRVAMDIGSRKHRVAIGDPSGKILEEFDLLHEPLSLNSFYKKLESYETKHKAKIVVAMEGYNGYARPIDQEILKRHYKLLNVNNNKLAKYKAVFSGPGKTDPIDARKILELMCLNDHVSLSSNALQEIIDPPEVNQKLKRLSRRRNELVEERISISNRMQSDLQAVSPGLLKITKSISNKWFLSLLTSRDELNKISKIRKSTLLTLKHVGKQYVQDIVTWQKTATFSEDIEWVGSMIQQDAKRLLELKAEIKTLEACLEKESTQSAIATRLRSIVGFGNICCATLAGELGTINRFQKESSLALYVGMTGLPNCSGKKEGSKATRHVNKRAKVAMMTGVARHIDHSAEAKKYYDKKRSEGKKHNQAVRALGRHLTRVIFSMLKNNRDYEIREKLIA